MWEIKILSSQTIRIVDKSELNESCYELAYYEDLDVLDYCKGVVHRYPTLSLIICDVSTIPITIVALKYVFSIGACVLTKYIGRMLSKNV